MFKIKQTKFVLSLVILFALAIGFYSCEQESFTSPETEITETSLFKQHLEDHTQTFTAEDYGKGLYQVIGEQGTIVNINDALVNSKGERVRGAVEVVLIEIYTVEDMILNRKQTLADYDGQMQILESGGEVFVKVYQDGEELFADGNGEMTILLPTENTGGAKKGMELFYGEETGEQIIWKPTGEPIKVVKSESRNGEDYLITIQNILGWVNVDVIWNSGGEEVDCVEVAIECNDFCEDASTIVALHVNAVNSAFELTYDAGSGTYKLCGGVEGPLPLGGITVSFIVAVVCPDGNAHVAIVTTTVSPGYHLEIIDCSKFKYMDPGQFEQALAGLI